MGLPISSSEVKSAQTGRGRASPTRSTQLHDSQEHAKLAFMSKMPGPERPTVLDAERHPVERSARPDRVEVAQDQGRAPARLGPRIGRGCGRY